MILFINIKLDYLNIAIAMSNFDTNFSISDVLMQIK